MNGKTNSLLISGGSSGGNVEIGYITLSSTQSSITVNHSVKNPKCAMIIPYGNTSLIDIHTSSGTSGNTFCVVQYDKVMGRGFMEQGAYGMVLGTGWSTAVTSAPAMTDSSCTFDCGYGMYPFQAISYMYVIIGE